MNAIDINAADRPLITIRDMSKHFQVKLGKFGQGKGTVHALDGISIDIRRGETLSVVGESGSGKSTLGLNLLQISRPSTGSVLYADQDLTQLDDKAMRPLRRKLQIIFQDPFSTLNPRMTVGKAIAQPMLYHGLADRSDVRAKVHKILADVGLGARYENHYPHEMSGGQCQRVVIGRALACQPEFIVCDEATSALDVSVQAQIINLLVDLQAQYNLTYLFIAHDLSVVRRISDRTAVLYLGRMVELAPTGALFEAPRHPYTQALMAAVPTFGKRKDRKTSLMGDMPSPLDPPPGCRFHTRCPLAIERCRTEVPVLRPIVGQTLVACHRAEETAQAGVAA